MKRPYELTTIYRETAHLDVVSMLNKINLFRQEMRLCSPLLDDWLLKGNTRDEAMLYEVFDSLNPSSAAVAVLTESLKGVIDPRIVSMWNGKEGADGASLQYVSRIAPETSMIVIRAKPAAFSVTAEPVLKLLNRIVEQCCPAVISLETAEYFDQKVFKDRPGVGWMLYLPLALNAQQVPEARALVPVMDKDMKGKNKQVGTIIVSVTDAPFSDENPDHVAIANAIEIRLVDQDLLPRYADL